MTFNEYVKRNFNDVTPYVEVGMNDLIVMQVEDYKATLTILKSVKDHNQGVKDLIQTIIEKPFLAKLEGYMLSRHFGNGPKIFRPTAYQLFMLEKMTLNIEVEDFNSPFENMIIELPKDYVKERSPLGQELHFAGFCYDKKTNFFLHSAYYDKHVYQSWWCGKPQQEIETWFEDCNDITETAPVGVLPVHEQEKTAEHLLRRAVLNYCLLLDETGVKKQGPESPNQYAQLVKWCHKNNKHTAKNKLELQAQPIVYSLCKEPVDLVRIVDSSDKLPADETGRTVGPHSRRGHYRQQVCGQGRLQRKRIRVPGCIVNKHLLTGPIGGSYTT